jgi:hypothetical protein
MRIACLHLFAALTLASCGGSSYGSCRKSSLTQQGLTVCVDYLGGNWSVDSAKADCTTAAGSYVSATCLPGSLGTCTFGGGNEVKWTFIALPDGGTAANICQENQGIFNP